MLPPLLEADRLERGSGALARRDRRLTCDEQGHHDVLFRAELREQVVELKYEAEVPGAKLRELPFAQLIDPPLADLHTSAVRSIECSENVQQRALSSAGDANDCQNRATRDREINASQDFDAFGGTGVGLFDAGG